MKKRIFITIPVVVILLAGIITGILLTRVKPDTSQVSQAQKIAEYSKPAVVRILNYYTVEWDYVSSDDADLDSVLNSFFTELNWQDINGTLGSGFFVNSTGYIVTNAHVVELSKLDDQEIADLSLDDLAQYFADYVNTYYSDYYETVTYNAARDVLLDYARYGAVEKFLYVYLPGSDYSGNLLEESETRLAADIKSYGAPIGEGKDAAVIKVEGKNFPILKIGDSDAMQLQDNIWVIGFPGAADTDLLSKDSWTTCTVNEGAISATDKKSTQGAPVLQISASTTHGNSGGPVVNDEGDVIGLLTFRGDTVNNQEVQGFNFVIPTTTVKEYISQSGAEINKFSSIDTLYREGLDLYWGGYYNDALNKFEDMQRIYPDHSEIKRLITACQTKSSESKVLWSNYKTAFTIFYVIAAAAIAALLLLTFLPRKKAAVKAAQTLPGPAPFTPPAAPPSAFTPPPAQQPAPPVYSPPPYTPPVQQQAPPVYMPPTPQQPVPPAAPPPAPAAFTPPPAPPPVAPAENPTEVLPPAPPAENPPAAPPPAAAETPEEKPPAPAGTVSFCQNCGSPVIPGTTFCKKCGSKI